jgi:hypothetical protein
VVIGHWNFDFRLIDRGSLPGKVLFDILREKLDRSKNSAQFPFEE